MTTKGLRSLPVKECLRMPWWQSAFTSISKSQSSDDNILPPENEKSGFFSSRRNRLLTRARKLLQPIDTVEVGTPAGQFRNNSARPVAAASASPQPLPLPELHVLLQREPKFTASASASASASVPLPSPLIIKEHKEYHDREKKGETVEATNDEAVDGHDLHNSRLVGQESRRSLEKTEIHPPQKQHTKTTSLDNFNNIPDSALCSPCSSMELSPQRNSYVTAPPIGLFQVWSAPELPLSDSQIVLNVSGYSNHKHTTSLDTSLLQSPSVTVHPLPLPPAVSMLTLPTPISPVASISNLSGASLASQSTPVISHCSKNDFVGTNITSHPSPISPVGNIPELMPTKSKWQKGKLIGRGTFGSVYVASNRENGALCAMKEVDILPDDSKSAECIRQLEQEIKVLSRLKHPNIVQYYGSEVVGDKFYIYLEYVHPGSINKFIHDHFGAITESVVRNFTRHILFGLAYLHGKKTIHRDIKGANLLVDAYGVVKLADFGMAKHLNGQTANLSLKGSPYWMAPELLQSAMKTDASCEIALAVDIWSLGCTIIEMMNGKPPWSEYEGAAALFKVLKETPRAPEIMSAEGKDFLQCCFRRNPAERPTASRLLDHPFVNYSNLPDACKHSNIEIKDSTQFLRERTRFKQDQVPQPLETAYNKK